MITTKEIVDLLIEDQESHEAVVRALHYNYEEFVNWSWVNVKYVAYALGSLRLKLPIHWWEEDNADIKKSEMALILWTEIDKVKDQIKHQFNERFKHSEN